MEDSFSHPSLISASSTYKDNLPIQIQNTENIILQQHNEYNNNLLQIESIGNLTKYKLVIAKIQNVLAKLRRVLRRRRLRQIYKAWQAICQSSYQKTDQAGIIVRDIIRVSVRLYLSLLFQLVHNIQHSLIRCKRQCFTDIKLQLGTEMVLDSSNLQQKIRYLHQEEEELKERWNIVEMGVSSFVKDVSQWLEEQENQINQE